MVVKTVVARFLFIVALVVFTGGAIYYLVTLENERMELQEEMRKLELSKQGLASVVTYLEESKEALGEKLKHTDKKLKALSAERDEARDKSAELAGEVAEKKGTIKYAETNIATYQNEKKKMIKHLKLLNTAFNEIKVEYDKMAHQKEAADSELEELGEIVKDFSKRDTTSLGTVVIR